MRYLLIPSGPATFSWLNRVGEKAYEAYVFGLCLRAVRELGVTPLLRGIAGAPTPFIFRGGPGQIHSQTRNYGYAEFALNGYTFEFMPTSNSGNEPHDTRDRRLHYSRSRCNKMSTTPRRSLPPRV